MRILYIAKHDSGGNDDEGSISYALEQLGHEVIKRPEKPRESQFHPWPSADLCLFHKWSGTASIREIRSVVPCVFWYFDLVDWPQDPTLASRCEARKRWMAEVIPLVDLGFCTDGDWVERWNGSRVYDCDKKLHVLRQGADERVVGFGKERERDIDVLFAGGVKGCGAQRESFVLELRKRYGKKFFWAIKSYREELRDLVARSKVVVCPDSPVTDRYWSNRVYVMAGFGGCILHPTCNYRVGLPGLLSYEDRSSLYTKIDQLVEDRSRREDAARLSLLSVNKWHLYRHRCEELVRVVKERLHVG